MSHGEDLRAAGCDPDLAARIETDYRRASLDPKTRALLDHAVKLTLEPSSCCCGDLDQLRAHGWTDEELHHANLVVSYFNFINRVADGLGVDLEPEMQGRERPPPWRTLAP